LVQLGKARQDNVSEGWAKLSRMIQINAPCEDGFAAQAQPFTRRRQKFALWAGLQEFMHQINAS
jgi:hypothetical protein